MMRMDHETLEDAKQRERDDATDSLVGWIAVLVVFAIVYVVSPLADWIWREICA